MGQNYKMEEDASFGAEIIDYNCNGPTANYENHVFCIRVWIGQKMYAVDRTYKSFCDLDARLRRKYPRSSIPILPLAAASYFAKRVAARKSPVSDLRLTTTNDLRASLASKSIVEEAGLTPEKGGKNSGRKFDSSEIIAQKRDPLNTYLAELLKMPEILLSDNLLYFLDEESVDGQILAGPHRELSQLDILFADEKPTVATVRRQLKCPFEVASNNVAIWDFKTSNFDIGFSITFSKVEVLKYQRYNSHLDPVRGFLEIVEKGNLEFCWDNRYSRMRAKLLKYLVKIVPKAEYEAARDMAADINRSKFQFSQQRASLKQALSHASAEALKHSTNFANLIPHVSRPSQVHSDGSAMLYRDESLEEELDRLKNEKKTLQMALAQAESTLLGERTAIAEYVEQLEDLGSQKEAVERDLASLRKEMSSLCKSLEQSATQPFRKPTADSAEPTAAVGKRSFSSSETSSLPQENDSAGNLSGEEQNELLKSPLGSRRLEHNVSEIIHAEAANKAEEFLNIICEKDKLIAELSQSNSLLEGQLSLLTTEMQQQTEGRNSAEQQLTKLKSERKMLKEFAIKLKSENESLQTQVTEALEKAGRPCPECEARKRLAEEDIREGVKALGLTQSASRLSNERAFEAPSSRVTVLRSLDQPSAASNDAVSSSSAQPALSLHDPLSLLTKSPKSNAEQENNPAVSRTMSSEADDLKIKRISSNPTLQSGFSGCPPAPPNTKIVISEKDFSEAAQSIQNPSPQALIERNDRLIRATTNTPKVLGSDASTSADDKVWISSSSQGQSDDTNSISGLVSNLAGWGNMSWDSLLNPSSQSSNNKNPVELKDLQPANKQQPQQRGNALSAAVSAAGSTPQKKAHTRSSLPASPSTGIYINELGF